jgi:Zn-dependent protease
MHLPPFGWAKPTPVDSRNFKRQVRDDIFTALAGTASNFVTAFLAIVGIALIVHFTAMGAPGPIGPGIFRGAEVASPLARMLEFAITINVVLGVFNLVPLPPLDGSHVLRHFLPYNSLQTYDRIGYLGLVILFFVLTLMGISVLDVFINPVMMLFEYLLRILIF